LIVLWVNSNIFLYFVMITGNRTSIWEFTIENIW